MKLNFKVIKNRQIYWRFLIAYVIKIPLVFGAIAYNNAHHTIKKYAIESNMFLLTQTKEIIERHMEEINHIVSTIINNKRIQFFRSVDDPFAGMNTFKVLELSNELAVHDIVNKFIDSYYICFKKSNLVISPSLVYRMSGFYDNYLKYKDITYEEWNKRFFNTYHNEHYLPAHDIVKDNNKLSVITYLQTFGYPQSDYLQGAIMVLINNEEIKKMLMGLDVANGGWAYIADNKGNIISSISEGNRKIEAVDSQILVNDRGSIVKNINNNKA